MYSWVGGGGHLEHILHIFSCVYYCSSLSRHLTVSKYMASKIFNSVNVIHSTRGKQLLYVLSHSVGIGKDLTKKLQPLCSKVNLNWADW